MTASAPGAPKTPAVSEPKGFGAAESEWGHPRTGSGGDRARSAVGGVVGAPEKNRVTRKREAR